MKLIILEHRKLWKRASVKAGVIVCFLYVVVFGSFLSFQWFSMGSHVDGTSLFGNRFDGYANIKDGQIYSEQWNGPITDEKLQAMVRDYQEKNNAKNYGLCQNMDWEMLNSWVSSLWPELEKPEIYDIMISYVDPDKLTGFYERREDYLDEFLDMNGASEEEKKYFLNMDSEADIPMEYGWTKGWSLLLGSILGEMGTAVALFIAIILSPTFCGEWSNNMHALIFTSKYGRRKIAMAKIASGILFAAELFALLAAGSIIIQLIFLGTKGADLPIQLIKLIATAPLSMIQAEIYEYAYIFLASIGFSGIVMMISAVFKSKVASVVMSLAVIYIPTLIYNVMPLNVQKLFDLIPLAGSPADIFRTNAYHIGGTLVYSPYMLLIVPVLLGMLCVPFAVRKWSRRLR